MRACAPAIAAAEGDYPELFDALLAPHGVELQVFAVDEGQLPASLDKCDAWMTSPSRSSVLGDDPWLPDALELVRRIVDEERPFAGICFGHQMLGQALGGRVERAAGRLGRRRAALLGRGAAALDGAAPADGGFTLIASHEDQVTELPPGAVRLAGTDHCPNAMFALGERAIGLQPHPEFTASISRAPRGWPARPDRREAGRRGTRLARRAPRPGPRGRVDRALPHVRRGGVKKRSGSRRASRCDCEASSGPTTARTRT